MCIIHTKQWRMNVLYISFWSSYGDGILLSCKDKAIIHFKKDIPIYKKEKLNNIPLSYLFTNTWASIREVHFKTIWLSFSSTLVIAIQISMQLKDMNSFPSISFLSFPSNFLIMTHKTTKSMSQLAHFSLPFWSNQTKHTLSRDKENSKHKVPCPSGLPFYLFLFSVINNFFFKQTTWYISYSNSTIYNLSLIGTSTSRAIFKLMINIFIISGII